jgi:hypothetical protein
MAEENKTKPAITQAVGLGAGVGIGALITSVVQGNPEIVRQVANWGPAIVIVAGVFLLADRHARPLIDAAVNAVAAQREQAAAMGQLSASLQERFRQDDDVRMATRTLTGEVEKLSLKMDKLYAVIQAKGAEEES